MSTLSTPLESKVKSVPPAPSLAAACERALSTLEWRPLLPLAVFIVLMHVVVRFIIGSGGFSFAYRPDGVTLLAILNLCGVVLASTYILAPQIVCDLRLKLRGLEPTPLQDRVANVARMLVCGWILTLLYTAVIVNNANLKPAIPHINPAIYDAPLEAFERGLFGGVLPGEWLIQWMPAKMLGVWELIYDRFALFTLVSLMIAINAEGMRGGARLTLALSMALCTTLMMTLAWPTRGPIYTHPEWFQALDHGPTYIKAQALLFSIPEYVADPPVRRIIGGISAMPSYHVMCWTCAGLCWRVLPRPLMVVGGLFVLLNWISTVVLGWHYALDGLVGLVLGIGLTWMAGRIIPRRVVAPADTAT